MGCCGRKSAAVAPAAGHEDAPAEQPPGCWKRFTKLLTWFIRRIPSPIRYFLTLIAFYPTVAYNRFVCLCWPHKRQLWNRVSAHVVLGSVPLRYAEIVSLREEWGVRGVVNMCKEWNAHDPSGTYAALGIRQLRLEVIDFDVPTPEAALAGARFIAEHAAREHSVYVHCKAGRGRSTCIVLAYLVVYCGLTPWAADAHVRAARRHISKKHHLPLFLGEAGVLAQAAAEREKALKAHVPVPCLVSRAAIREVLGLPAHAPLPTLQKGLHLPEDASAAAGPSAGSAVLRAGSGTSKGAGSGFGSALPPVMEGGSSAVSSTGDVTSLSGPAEDNDASAAGSAGASPGTPEPGTVAASPLRRRLSATRAADSGAGVGHRRAEGSGGHASPPPAAAAVLPPAHS